MIRAIVFDLDNSLAASDEAGRDFMEPTFAAIRRANRGTLSEEALERAFEDCWRRPLDRVASEHGFSEEMLSAGFAENVRAEVRAPMRGYGDLDVIESLPVRLFLVTSGFRRLQESKIRALGIDQRFERIHVDAPEDPGGRKGKERVFAEILREQGFEPGEVLVVGDDEETEIAAGNRLGMPTVQILRPGKSRGTKATHVISSLEELPALLRRIG